MISSGVVSIDESLGTEQKFTFCSVPFCVDARSKSRARWQKNDLHLFYINMTRYLRSLFILRMYQVQTTSNHLKGRSE